MAETRFSGPVRANTKETDGELFIPASDFQFDVGTWTLTRSAVGNYFMRKTAAANTSNPSISVQARVLKKIGADPGSSAHDIRGVQVTAIDVLYAIATDVLTAHTAAFRRSTYANNAAVVTAAVGGALAGALATATQANPYLTALTPATPFVLGNNVTDVADWFELTVTATATCVYDLYGVFVRFSYNLL